MSNLATVFRRYSLVVAVLGTALGIFGLGTVSALYTTPQIEAKLSNGVATAVSWDTGCRNNLRNNIGINDYNTLRNSINGDGSYTPAAYIDRSWLSNRGVPNAQSPTPVNWGQTSFPLQINSVTFICGPLVAPETYSSTTNVPKNPASLNLVNQTARWVLSSSNANDRAPNPVGSYNMRPARVDTLTKIMGYDMPANRPGSSLSGVNSQIFIQRSNSTRYWFPAAPVNVVYTDPAGITKPTTISITMRYIVIQGYHRSTFPGRAEGCRNYPSTVGQNLDINSNNCGIVTATLTITFAPTASLAAKTTVTPSSVFPGQTATFTHTITKTGSGSANYVKRLCGGYFATPQKTTTIGGCGAYSAASNSFTTTHAVTPTAANAGQYYCERIAYARTSTSAEAGSSVADCFLVRPFIPSCGSFNVAPTDPDPVTQFSVRVSVGSNTVVRPAGTMTLRLIPLAGNTWSYGPVTQALPAGTFPAEATFGPIGPTNQTGRWQVSWTYTDISGATLTCQDPADILTVANKPYVAVYGGDVAVGNSPTIETSCYTNVEGGAYGWSNYTTNFRGAGAQYAVMALGTIQEFASSLGTNTPDKLVFANVDYGPADPAHDVAAGLYGGMFGATNTPCDFLSDINVASQNGPSMTVPASIPAGETVQYAKGDVYINNNVVYGTTSWGSNLAAIPSYKLVVEGDIYIDNDVSQLDGLYVALTNEDGDSGGNIYTCATSQGNDVKPATPGFYDTCRTKLTVNGAFVAKQLHLQRTIGTLGQSTTDTPAANNAAEVFNYTPELWLPRNSTVGTGRYMSITGLPPIL